MTRTYLQSLQQGLGRIMEADPAVHVIGEDIVDPYGGAFKVTKGLSTSYPDRVWSTPISEGSIVGLSAGMACRGVPVIVEIMFGDFVTLCADQVVNHISKFQAMYGAGLEMPLVIRAPMGGGRGYGPTHSQSLERLFFGLPHLQIVAPCQFHDPGKELERALATKKPTLFIEHKLLYPADVGEASSNLSISPPTDASIGAATMVRNFSGTTPDITIVAYGGAALLVQTVLERMVAEEVKVAACFPIDLQLLDMDRVLEECRASRRVLVVEEGWRSFGWGSEVVAVLQEALWHELEAPVRRVGAAPTVIPAAREMEKAMLPSVESIEQALIETLS